VANDFDTGGSSQLNDPSAGVFAGTPKKGGGGFTGFLNSIPGVGWVGHELHQTEEDVVNTIRNMPTGLVYMAEHPVRSIEAMPGQIYQDIRHPLRHPFNTALDATMLIGGAGAIAGRVAELGRVATGVEEAGMGAGRAAEVAAGTAKAPSEGTRLLHAAVFGPKTPIREIKYTPAGGKETKIRYNYYSRNPAIRLAQKQLDKLHEQFPDKHLILWRSQASRVQKGLFGLKFGRENVSNAAADALYRRYHSATPAQHEAVAQVLRGVLPKDQLDYIQNDVLPSQSGEYVKTAKGFEARTLEAQKYLEPYEVTTPETRVKVPEGGSPIVETVKPAEQKLFKNVPNKWLEQHISENPELSGQYARVARGGNITLDHAAYDSLLADAKEAAGLHGAFTPSKEWQTVPEGTVIPPGAHIRMNMETGLNEARWDNPPPPRASAGDADPALRASARHLVTKLNQQGRPAEAVTRNVTEVVTHPGGTYTLSRIREKAGPTEFDPEGKVSQKELDYLRGYVKAAKAVSDSRTNQLIKMGALDPVSAVTRTLGAKNVIERRGLIQDLKALAREIQNHKNFAQREGISAEAKAAHLAEAEKKQLELDYWTNHLKVRAGELGNQQLSMEMPEAEAEMPHPIEDPALAKLLARVPEVVSGDKINLEGVLRTYRGGKIPLPPELTHAYQGVVLSHGVQEPNVAAVIAGSYHDAARFLYLNRIRDMILAAAADTPEGIPEQYRLPIVTDYWGGKLPMGFHFPQEMMNKGDSLTGDEAEAAGRFWEQIRQMFMDPRSAVEWANRTFKEPSRSLRFAQEKGSPIVFQTEKDLATRKIPGIKWIDRRMLGGLDQPNPIWSAMDKPGLRTFVHMTDAINTAQKASVLYLKPSYLLPNMLGNVALAMIHQGFLSPLNLAKSARALFTGKGFDQEVVDNIRAASGSGFTGMFRKSRSISGRIQRGSNVLSGAYGKLIDDPFRFSAFLHEAREQGFVTNADMKRLFNNPENQDVLDEITMRANDALINYERLGPGEQAILRRLVFFYPWLKGSTRYSYQMLINHPVASGFLGQEGQQGTGINENLLGPLPSWLGAAGLVPLQGGRQVVNPQSTQLFGTPADIVENIANILQGHPIPDISMLPQNLSPADTFLYTLLTGHTTMPTAASSPRYIRAASEAFGSQPWWQLIKNLKGGGNVNWNSVYPVNPVGQAVMRYLLTGGLTPRTFNRWKANEEARRQIASTQTGYQT